MGKRMKKTTRREEYKEKFNEQMNKFNYIPQDGEKIVQCKAPYPEYWFISNKGYLFSVYSGKIKILKANHRYTGVKNKYGIRPGQDWYYEYVAEGEKYNRHVTMYRVISDHFLKNEFDSANDEIHHIRKKVLYKPNEGNVCNRAENLQLLPREIHKELTHYASKTNAEHDKELEKKIREADCSSYQFTQEQFEALIKWNLQNCAALGMTPVIYMTTITDDVSEIEAEAHPLKFDEI